MLHLDRTAYEALLDHAREETPEEACGLLVGSVGASGTDEGPSRVERIHRMQNVAQNPEVTYEIDPEAQFRVMEELETQGWEVVGFYHSHPRGPDGPSTTDHARATWQGYHYLIVSLGGEIPMVDAWVWTGEGFARDDVTIEPR